MQIKIFGERNTATNALTQVIRKNSETKVLPGTMGELSPSTRKHLDFCLKHGISVKEKEAIIDQVFAGRGLLEQWKHSATYYNVEEIEGVHFIFTVRNPLSWLVGLYRKPYHLLGEKPSSLLEFAQKPWRTVQRDNLPNQQYKPLELYAEKLQSYIDLIEKLEAKSISYSIIRFEDFVADQQGAFDKLVVYLDKPSECFEMLNTSTKDNNKDADFYKKYYANERWRIDFPQINDISDQPYRSIFETFGYS